MDGHICGPVDRRSIRVTTGQKMHIAGLGTSSGHQRNAANINFS
jgi:hypothetical protein